MHVLLGREASMGSRKSPSLLTAIRLKSWHTKGQTPHGSFVEHARAATVIKTKLLESTENRRKMQGRSVPIRMTFTASQHAANKYTSAAIDGSTGFRKMAHEMYEQMSLTAAFDY